MPTPATLSTGRPSSAHLAAVTAHVRADQAQQREKQVASLVKDAAADIRRRVGMAADGGQSYLSADIRLGADLYDAETVKAVASALEAQFADLKLVVHADKPMPRTSAAEEPRLLGRFGSGMSVSRMSITADWSGRSTFTRELRERTAVANARLDGVDKTVADSILARVEKELNRRMEKAAEGGEDFLRTTLNFGVSVERQEVLDLVKAGMEQRFADKGIKVWVDRAMHNTTPAEEPNMLVRWLHGKSVVSRMDVQVSW